MGNQNIGKIPQAMEKLESGDFKHVVFVGDEDELPPRIDADFDSKKTASIPITYGCNNFCTYCIVPYVRGRERSVPMNQILDEVKRFVEKGYREVILLGQNVNSYGNDSENKEMTFARLLEEICKIEGDFLVRFISPHPRDFTDDVIDVIAANEKIARCLHLPLQSGSSRVLKAMNRGYTKEEYIALAAKIKERVPGAALTADIIVGFPGETEEDFEQLKEFIREFKFDYVGVFPYSREEDTVAHDLPNQVDEETKRRRAAELTNIQAEVAEAKNREFIGKEVEVIIDGVSSESEYMLEGRTRGQALEIDGKVLTNDGMAKQGEIVKVKIEQNFEYDLLGPITKNEF
jgi:tRNA-2-methylthio-N6-dimethylallyladenosine synthase